FLSEESGLAALFYLFDAYVQNSGCLGNPGLQAAGGVGWTLRRNEKTAQRTAIKAILCASD
ncbi:MAG: hypothetical protein NC489_34190, partial [Ruminococcus flavefaciens]|nr:hypothetical protein [Ruminococcus flavefaciens]